MKVHRPGYPDCCHSSDQYWSWSEASSSASSAPGFCAADAIAATVPCNSGCAKDMGAAARAGPAGRLPVAPFAHLCSGPRFLIRASMYLQHNRRYPVTCRTFSLLLLACLAAHPVQEGVPEQLKETNDTSQHISEARAVHDFRAVRGPSAHMYIAGKLTCRCAAAAAWPPAGWGLRRPWLQAEPVQAREGRQLR